MTEKKGSRWKEIRLGVVISLHEYTNWEIGMMQEGTQIGRVKLEKLSYFFSCRIGDPEVIP